MLLEKPLGCGYSHSRWLLWSSKASFLSPLLLEDSINRMEAVSRDRAQHIVYMEETLFTPMRLPGWDMTAPAAPMLECFAVLAGAVPVCLSVQQHGYTWSTRGQLGLCLCPCGHIVSFNHTDPRDSTLKYLCFLTGL